MTASETARDVLDFWREAGPDRWFKKDEEFDKAIGDRFLGLHERAAAGDLDHWSDDADGSLALLLVLDQFSRNLFRDSPRAFAQDPAALAIAGKALRQGFEGQFDTDMRSFFYLPYEHSERLADQHRSVMLIHSLGNLEFLHYAIVHRDVISRFGRFPHRNAVLRRHSSPAEIAFLDAGGFSA